MASYAFSATSISGNTYPITVDRVPDKCPICHHHIDPIWQTGRAEFALPIANARKLLVEAIYQCPRQSCYRLFIAGFTHRPSSSTFNEFHISITTFELTYLAPKTFQPRQFPPEIEQISPSFVEFFNQSAAAEAFELTDIAGPGYGKALEFLIKDYLISQCESDLGMVAAIKKEFLGNVINNRITDSNIKKCAERAAWLRNDETHYERRWEDKDINDLKKLVTLTVNWIHNSLLTDAYSDMKK